MKYTMQKQVRKNGHITEWYSDFPIKEYYCHQGYKFVFDAPTTSVAKAWLEDDSDDCLVTAFVGTIIYFTEPITRVDYVEL